MSSTDNTNSMSSIDSLVQAAMAKNQLPAVALGLSKNGQVFYTQSYGQSMLPNPSFELGLTANPDTQFALGSVTKSFTAVAVMLLQDQGKLSVSDNLGTYIDDLPDPWNATPIYRFLSMTAGLQDIGSNTQTWQQIVQQAFADGLYKNQPPGSLYEYSNPSFMLMGQLIESASGTSYDEYVTQNVLDALGVDAFFRTATRSPENLATGYFYSTNSSASEFTGQRPPTSSFSAGAMSASATGLTQYICALQSQQLLSSDSYNAMWSPVELNDKSYSDWGYGWAILLDDSSGEKTVRKDGGLPGAASLVTIQVLPDPMPNDQNYYAVALVTNTKNGDTPGALVSLTEDLLSLLG